MEQIFFQHPRDQIVEIMRRIYGRGMTTTSGGNLSVMDSFGDMWISPGGIDKGTLHRNDIVCVKPNNEIIGTHKPSSEFPFHRDIYKLRGDVKAILHAHPPMLVSFSVAGQVPNTLVHPTAKAVCSTVGYAPYEVPGSDALGKKVSSAFAQGHSTILLENHGTCCASTTLLQAFQKFETLDFCARIINNAFRLGTPHYLSESDVEFHSLNRNNEFTPAVLEKRSAFEMEMRYQMSLLIKRAYSQQLFTSTEGTFAVRVDKDSFIITPSHIDRGSIAPEDLVLVSGHNYEQGKNLSSATWFFKAIFDAQPDINSLIISNPPNIMGYAVSHESFDPRVIPESYILLREMPTFQFGAHFHDLGEITRTLSPRYPVIIIENDCLLTSGSTLLQSYDRMEVAEYSAKATINAKNLGGLKPITGKQIDDLITAFNLIP